MTHSDTPLRFRPSRLALMAAVPALILALWAPSSAEAHTMRKGVALREARSAADYLRQGANAGSSLARCYRLNPHVYECATIVLDIPVANGGRAACAAVVHVRYRHHRATLAHTRAFPDLVACVRPEPQPAFTNEQMVEHIVTSAYMPYWLDKIWSTPSIPGL